MSYQIGDIIPSHFNPAIVTASYFASLCGCLLTVELLHRRGTGISSLRSWLDTLASATALGVMGIWCMHFIGNRAITLGNGESNIQLVYNPGFSALSVFLPIMGLSIAFAAAEYPSRSPALHWTALACTGVFAGLSIVGMHYIGNFGISNYSLKYESQFLAGSIIVAIGDCLAVLLLFYNWREKWISVWWKRALCAVSLAGGISAMHFTASTRCIYTLKSYNAASGRLSRNIQAIVAGVLCGTAAVITLGVLFFTRHRARVLKKGSRKIMIACAMFDPDGRIIVTTEGVLPAREITDKFNHRTFDEEFDRAHPVFRWIFRVTYNWSSVSDLVPDMGRHIGAHSNSHEDLRSSKSYSSVSYDSESHGDYSVFFRERFCTAAASLASAMHLPLEKIGVLYDHIVDTGTLTSEAQVKLRDAHALGGKPVDIETGLRFNPVGKGQLLFLTRRLTVNETFNLLNAGFRSASVERVGRNIAEAMQIPLAVLNVHMSALLRYADSLSPLGKPGTWFSCFALMPKANSKGFDVVVKRNEQDQLPDVHFLPCEPLAWQAAFLQRMDQKSAPSCMTFLEDRQRRDVLRTAREQQFASAVLNTMIKLWLNLPHAFSQNARFCGKPLHAHYSQRFRSTAPATILYSFVVCADLHTSLEIWPNITRIPLSFFKVRHQCYSGSPNHQALALDIHKEFKPLLAQNEPAKESQGKKNIACRFLRLSNKALAKHSRRPSLTRPGPDGDVDSSLDSFEFDDSPQRLSKAFQNGVGSEGRNDFMGGILVNSETVVDPNVRGHLSNDSLGGSLGIGTKVAIGTAKPEESFIDELLSATRGMLPSRPGS